MCDKDGCEFNPYRLGAHDFYGKNGDVDPTQPITVVTQFKTHDGTDDGDLVEIKRFYVQNNFQIPNTESSIKDVKGDSLTDEYCNQQKKSFEVTRVVGNPYGDFNQFKKIGGIKQMGKALERGMALVLSLWDDPGSGMNWLDSFEPQYLHKDTPGAVRGPCDTDAGKGQGVRQGHPDAYVTYTNIRYGEMGSTMATLAEFTAFPGGPIAVTDDILSSGQRRPMAMTLLSVAASAAVAAFVGSAVVWARRAGRRYQQVASPAAAVPLASVSGTITKEGAEVELSVSDE